MSSRLVKNDVDVLDNSIKNFLEYGEKIKPIGPEFPYYYVTSYGKIFSNKKKINYRMQSGEILSSIFWVEMKQRKTSKKSEYLSVNLYNREGKKVRHYVHHLVFRAFNHGAILDFDAVKIVHIDKNKQNNRIGNLALAWRKKEDYQTHKNYAYRTKMMQGLLKEV